MPRSRLGGKPSSALIGHYPVLAGDEVGPRDGRPPARRSPPRRRVPARRAPARPERPTQPAQRGRPDPQPHVRAQRRAIDRAERSAAPGAAAPPGESVAVARILQPRWQATDSESDRRASTAAVAGGSHAAPADVEGGRPGSWRQAPEPAGDTRSKRSDAVVVVSATYTLRRSRPRPPSAGRGAKADAAHAPLREEAPLGSNCSTRLFSPRGHTAPRRVDRHPAGRVKASVGAAREPQMVSTPPAGRA